MPVATIDPSEYAKYELKSAPPDGYIMLRPLPYGMKLARRDKASTMKMRAITSGSGAPRLEDVETVFETANEWTVAYDFAYCIGEHNLTDKNGALLQFNDPKTVPMTLKQLNPRVGSEIERYLFELNEEEDAESLEDFLKRSVASSTEEGTQSSTDSGEIVQNVTPMVTRPGVS